MPDSLCCHPDDVARTSSAAFAISYSFAMLISFLSGAAWDMVGKVDAVSGSTLFVDGGWTAIDGPPTGLAQLSK